MNKERKVRERILFFMTSSTKWHISRLNARLSSLVSIVCLLSFLTHIPKHSISSSLLPLRLSVIPSSQVNVLLFFVLYNCPLFLV